MASLDTGITHDAARRLARGIAGRLAETEPGRFVVNAAPDARKGRIFIDYLRNGSGNTAVGAFSPRTRPGFPIAHPVTWREIQRSIRPNAFTMEGLMRQRAHNAA